MSRVLHKSLMDIQPRDLADLVADVPGLPLHRLDLLRRMRDPETPVAEIAEQLCQDQVLVDKVLLLVNSAFAGSGPAITSLSRAVVILGFRAVRSAVLAVSIIEYFKAEVGDRSQWLAFWRHSVAVAAASKVFAHELRFNQPEEAFLVGLLHDVGKLFEERHFPADCREVYAVAEEQHYSWHQCEKALFAVNHAGMAAAFLGAWEFPDNVVDAVEHHHEPDRSTGVPQLTALVHVADIAAYDLDHGAPGTWPPGAASPAALLLLGVTMADVDHCHDKIRTEMESAHGVFALVD